MWTTATPRRRLSRALPSTSGHSRPSNGQLASYGKIMSGSNKVCISGNQDISTISLMNYTSTNASSVENDDPLYLDASQSLTFYPASWMDGETLKCRIDILGDNGVTLIGDASLSQTQKTVNFTITGVNIGEKKMSFCSSCSGAIPRSRGPPYGRIHRGPGGSGHHLLPRQP